MVMKRRSVIFAVLFTAGLFLVAGNADARKPKKPKFVGSQKCDGSCHDPWYKAWKDTGHGQAYSLLKKGARPDRKKKAGLEDKDYTEDPQCLRCHTTGYKQKGGFKVKKHKNEDPSEPNFTGVGCEMCHSVMGGAMFRVIMKKEKEKFKREKIEAVGYRMDMPNVCFRCHTHKNTPFKPTLDPKYKFNFEERKKKVHPVEKFRDEENKEQIVTKGPDGYSIHGHGNTGVKGGELPIEDWEIVDGKFKKKNWAKWDKKAKKIIWVQK